MSLQKHFILSSLGILLLGVTACSNKSTEEDFSKESNTIEITSSENIDEMVDAKLTGGFTVTMRALSPDYCEDDTTLTCAIVTYFQSPPFVLYVGEELASELDVGETYTFTITERSIGKVPESMIGTTLDCIDIQADYGRVEINSFKKATEDEYGLTGKEIFIIKE